MPIGDDVAVREPSEQPLVPAVGSARVVDHPDPKPAPLEREPLGQLGPERRLVDVAADRPHGRPERSKKSQRLARHDVPCVQHELCAPQNLDARIREPPRAARHMRVTDERDQENPGRKRPSR